MITDKENNNFYITTTLPYINSEPHLGFAAEIIKADVIARYQRQLGKEVFFNTGTDEHGLKIYRKAKEMNLEVQEYCDLYSAKFLPLKDKLNLSYTKFIRTTDKDHQASAQTFWQQCLANGDIYKQKYQVKYCIGCEMEKTDSDLDHGKCPLHPNLELEIIDEENYFFRFSKYQDQLLELYRTKEDFVLPDSRLKEIESFVKSGLKDFSISRQKDKMPHGVPVPGDDEQVMYVWFDALVNYISTLGWPKLDGDFARFWPGIQVCGKDNLRPQSAMWPAMLLSAGIEPQNQVLVFGFLTADGKKMSKSLGNTVDPLSLADQYGADALRYYLLAEIPTFSDGDYSLDKFKQRYNADLANGLGNLSARLANLLCQNKIETNLKPDFTSSKYKPEFDNLMAKYNLAETLRLLWTELHRLDEDLSKQAPWKLADRAEIETILVPLAQELLNISYLLIPFIPDSATKIYQQYSANQITKGDILFPRLK